MKTGLFLRWATRWRYKVACSSAPHWLGWRSCPCFFKRGGMELPSTEAFALLLFPHYWPDRITDALIVSSQTTHVNSESSMASLILLLLLSYCHLSAVFLSGKSQGSDRWEMVRVSKHTYAWDGHPVAKDGPVAIRSVGFVQTHGGGVSSPVYAALKSVHCQIFKGPPR